MKKALGIVLLLFFICLLTALLTDRFLTGYNIENLIRRSALFGIISIGAAFVIMTSGIDLSIGSMVCIAGCSLPWLLSTQGWPVSGALLAVLGLSAGIGLFHGLLVTKLRIQPFVVTLCGLLLYRGAARGLTRDQTQGFGTSYETLRKLATGKISLPFFDGFAIPAPCFFLLAVAAIAGVFLNYTIYGRYLLALGRNEQAAQYSGIDTARMTLLAYGVCGFLGGLGGVLFVLDVNSAQPADFGNFYELYAIAAAVLGGCSLRGGEGTILGVVVGAAVMQVLRNSITLLGVPTQLEFAIIGAVILVGVIADEVVKRLAARQREEWRNRLGP
ncbi:MAG: ABC transporter permease [Acidimicrobiia bacterium]|nr:ABC transporter permease [Acidimicrobiia bacterium]